MSKGSDAATRIRHESIIKMPTFWWLGLAFIW